MTTPQAAELTPLSDPMSVRQLAELFGFGRGKMAEILKVTPGAEQFGGKWRLPISKMPVSWLLDAGLIVPDIVELPHSNRLSPPGVSTTGHPHDCDPVDL